MKRIFLIPAVAFVLLSVGCAGNSTQNETTIAETEATVDDEHHHGEVAEVQLDNGEKWQANFETSEGIGKMLLAVDSVSKNEAPNYLALKENLDKEFMVVLEKCTMTGEAHDQLHNYLLSLKAKFDKLGTSSTKQDIEGLTHYLTTYKEFFK